MFIGFSFYLSEGDTGAGLATDQTTETGLVLDDAIRDSHLAAQGRQENDQLKQTISLLVSSFINLIYNL